MCPLHRRCAFFLFQNFGRNFRFFDFWNKPGIQPPEMHLKFLSVLRSKGSSQHSTHGPEWNFVFKIWADRPETTEKFDSTLIRESIVPEILPRSTLTRSTWWRLGFTGVSVIMNLPLFLTPIWPLELCKTSKQPLLSTSPLSFSQDRKNKLVLKGAKTRLKLQTGKFFAPYVSAWATRLSWYWAKSSR